MQTPVYANLNQDENAELFIRSCAGIIQRASGFTGCTFSGNNVHASGIKSANIVIKGPIINAPGNTSGGTPFDLDCSGAPDPAACSTIQNDIVRVFQEQGGTFPVTVIKRRLPLPGPTLVTQGAANNYCLEARSARSIDIVYNVVPSSDGPTAGRCNTASLHYP